MRILKRIIIENFQCHPKTVIDVAPTGLTIITGPTDHGKSAMVRAIKWLTTNRPQGDDFIRHGQNECKVTFEYTDGVTVQRRRTTSLNQYYVNNQLFEGFGTSVPLEVQQATGIYVYEVADQTFYLNISEQLAGPFLGSSISAPLRAKILGKWAGTEDVDRANKKLGTDVYHAKQKKKQLEEDIFNLDADIDNYKWVKPLGEKLEKLEQIQDKIGKQAEKLELLRQKKEHLKKVNAEIEQIEQDLEWYYDVLPDVSQIFSGIEPDMPLMKDLINKKDNLNQLNTGIIAEKLTIQDCGQPKEALKMISNANTNINQLEASEQQLQRLIGLNRKLVQADIEIGQNRAVKKCCGNPAEAMKVLDKCNDDINTHSTLESKKNEYVRCAQNIMARKISMTIFNGVDEAKNIINDMDNQITHLFELKDRQNDYRKKIKAVNDHSDNIEIFEKVINKAKVEVGKAKEKYKSVLKESGICPYCGSEVEDECLDHVV